ncbi:F0F1 ATP synthase subunit A [Inquilinus sp. CAU 1745]|uniref:F0F1 ATP synthase subunit A n=1 Tax=Inquilinus sp. CAU 1745 TaxID=3140369 RepID=UPI00325BC9F3
MAGPLEQFEIKPIVPIQVGDLDLSFTNSSLFMVIAAVLITAFLTTSMRGRALVPTRLQSLAELSYEVIANMIRDNVGSDGRKYFPFVFSLFMFVLFGNLLGLIPGAFTFTSHIIVTFALAALIFIGTTIIGIARHGTNFLQLFFPPGAPLWTAVILVPVELVSYLSRPISLSVRLFANMTVGHVMLKVIGGFVVVLGVFGVLPILALVAITGLEVLIAVIQAYVFAILTCVYLHDALHLH